MARGWNFLEALLKDEIRCLKRLVTLSQEEQEAMLRGEWNEVLRLHGKINHVRPRLGKLEAERAQTESTEAGGADGKVISGAFRCLQLKERIRRLAAELREIQAVNVVLLKNQGHLLAPREAAPVHNA